MRSTVLSLLVILVLAACVCSYSQSSPPTPTGAEKANKRPVATPTPSASIATADDVQVEATVDDDDVIKVTTQLVSVPVRVMDKRGRFVAGLAKENFKVFEDGAEQEIAMFSNEHEPFTVVLMLDMSYSSTFKISEIQSAAIEFIDQLRPADKVMVVSFDQDVHVLCEATNDRNAIYRAIHTTKVSTGTSLYEAVDLVINDRLRQIEGRKAVILFTDGVDTTSRRVTERDNLSDAMELDALIYPIRYDTFADVQSMKNKPISSPPKIYVPDMPKSKTNPIPDVLTTVGRPSDQGTTAKEYEAAEEYLNQMADRTGGRIYLASSLVNLADAFSKIASELREFYSLGYYPEKERSPGQRTNVKVRVDQPGLSVRARETYLSRHKNKK